MSLIALIIGLVLIIAAVRNSQGALFTALEADVPKFVVWAAAIIAVGAIGAIPGLKPVSRWLLALIVVVIIVNNYKKLVTGFQDAWQNSAKTDQPANTSSGASATSAATGAAVPAGSPYASDALNAGAASGGGALDFLKGFVTSNPFN
jgi:hypothetical protein